MIAETDRNWHGVVDAARRSTAQGERPWFGARYCRETDGTYRATVSDLPNVDIHVTGRKGVEGAVRPRIALVLDVGVDDFDLTVQGLQQPRRPSPAG